MKNNDEAEEYDTVRKMCKERRRVEKPNIRGAMTTTSYRHTNVENGRESIAFKHTSAYITFETSSLECN